MLSSAEEVKVLMDLGLTSCQARVYLAFCHYGILDTKTVSTYAGVPRQDVYRVTLALQELGLIEKIISRPVTFKATKVDNGTATLLRQRKKVTKTLESKTKDLLDTFKTENLQVQPNKPEFVLVPGKQALIERIRHSIEKSQSRIDLVSSWKRFSHFLSFASLYKTAWLRGVRCRFIIEKPQKNSGSKHILDLCYQSSFCQVRFVPSPPNTVLSVYDKKEILIIKYPQKDLPESPALWSSNHSILFAMQDYFDILWITANEEPNYWVDDD